jgi:hypothetical protein
MKECWLVSQCVNGRFCNEHVLANSKRVIKTEGRKEAELNDRGFNRRKNTTSSLTQEKSNHVEHT